MRVDRGGRVTEQPLMGWDAGAAAGTGPLETRSDAVLGDLLSGGTPLEMTAAGEGGLTDTLLLRAGATTADVPLPANATLPDRRRPARGRSRRWLVHRLLVLADVIGLLA